MAKRDTSMGVRLTFLIMAVIAVGASVRAQEASTVADVIEEIRFRSEFEHSTFGIAFYNLESGEWLYRLNAEALFTPASTTKLLTEGTALALLGADFRFYTRVYGTGPIDDGTLFGDLVLVGSGDPNLSNRIRPDGTLAYTNHDHAYDGTPETAAVAGDPLKVIRDLARQIADRGIERIAGRVIVDATLFPGGQPELGSGAIISPLAINDNIVDVTITPGVEVGDDVRLSVSPKTSYVEFVNNAATDEAGSERSIEWARDVSHADGTHTVYIEGSLPVDGEAILYAYKVPVPRRYGEIVLAEALQAEGIVARPVATDAEIDFESMSRHYQTANVLAEHVSPPFSEEVKVTLKVSQNLHASMTPYILGAYLGPDTAPVLKAGFQLEHEFLTEAGLEMSAASQSDGAGGHRADFFTPEFMVTYLAYMAERDDIFEAFHRALPILGVDGTLATIQTKSPGVGHVHAKTGTYIVRNRLNQSWMLTSKALAGYVTTKDGHRLAFALYLNRMPSDLPASEVADIAGEALGEIAGAAFYLPIGSAEPVHGSPQLQSGKQTGLIRDY